MMLKKGLALLAAMAVVGSAHAQFTWVNGFVVTNENDTLRGQVQVNTPAVSAGKMVFKSETVDKIIHKPFQIQSWGSEDGTVYDSKEYKMGTKGVGVFMRRHTPPGVEVHLYEYWNGAGDNGFAQLFMEKQLELTEVQLGKFKKQMPEYFSDNETIVQGINEGKYKKSFDGVLQLINEYNAARSKRWD